jgi:hypothetical protein
MHCTEMLVLGITLYGWSDTTDYATLQQIEVRIYVNGVEQTFSTSTNMSQILIQR